MESNLEKEKILEIPTQKKKLINQSNEIFSAEINANDHNLNGIIEDEKSTSQFNELKDYMEGEFYI